MTVVVATQGQVWQVGQVMDVALPAENRATGSNFMAGIQFNRARLENINLFIGRSGQVRHYYSFLQKILNIK